MDCLVRQLFVIETKERMTEEKRSVNVLSLMELSVCLVPLSVERGVKV